MPIARRSKDTFEEIQIGGKVPYELTLHKLDSDAKHQGCDGKIQLIKSNLKECLKRKTEELERSVDLF